MYAAIYLEINLLCGLLLLLILRKFKENDDQQAASLAYRRVVIATLLILLLDAAWVIIETQTGPAFAALNSFVNAAYLFNTDVISYLWLQFILCRLRKNFRPSARARLLIATPLLLQFILCALSPWTH